MATITESTPTKSLEGFFKVGTDAGPSLVHVVMWNPETGELRRIVVEDYEYAYPDGPFMTDAIREYGLAELERIHDADVDGEALRDFNVHYDIAFVGAEVKVVKGRKVPVGTVGTITRIREVSDRYGRHVATYADIKATDGTRHSTSTDNLKVVG